MPTIIKPSWVSHDGHPIYSIDIHPESNKFATGSLDSKIKIWSFIPLKDPSKDVQSEHRLLSTLVSHAGAVNSVRWSRSGTYLASGSDDQTVIIWEKKSGPGSKVFGSKEVNVENWWPKLILQGHTGDVIDVCWSMDSTMVASCSVDNKIFIWSVNSKDPIRVLSHEGLIKGLSWDPTGRYIASQSDEGTTIIWRISDGAKESEIHKPFRNSKLSFFMRPSWSPDGQYLVTANGMKRDKHIAPIIHRANWQSNLEYVGHKGAVIAAKFNPVIFVSQDTPFYICALASQDTLLSIWTSNRYRPLLVVENLFSKAIVDLSWSSDGLSLLSCSQDGNISVIIFKQEELGERMNQKELDLHWKKLYGDSNITMTFANIVEDPFLLKIKKEAEKEESDNVVKNEVSITLGSTDRQNSESQRTVTQIETKLANGKRRIQPIYLSSLNETPSITVFSTQKTIDEANKTRSTTEKDESTRVGVDEKIKELLPVKKPKISENYADHFLHFHPNKLDYVIKNNILPLPEPSHRIEQRILEKEIHIDISGLEEGKCVISKIKCLYKSLILWKTEIFGIVTIVSGSPNLFAIGCYSGDVYIFSPRGRRLSPCLKSSSSPVYILEIFDSLVLAIHCDGAVRLWDVEKNMSIVETNLSPIVKKTEQFEILSAGVTSSNYVYIITENGCAYMYDPPMDCWFNIYDSIYNFSEYPPFDFINRKEGILYEVFKSSMSHQNSIKIMEYFSDEYISENTISFLEDQISLTNILDNKDENKKWIKLYLKKLKDHPSKIGRLEEINNMYNQI